MISNFIFAVRGIERAEIYSRISNKQTKKKKTCQGNCRLIRVVCEVAGLGAACEVEIAGRLFCMQRDFNVSLLTTQTPAISHVPL